MKGPRGPPAGSQGPKEAFLVPLRPCEPQNLTPRTFFMRSASRSSILDQNKPVSSNFRFSSCEARPIISADQNAPVTKLGLMSEKTEFAACHGGIPTGFHAPLPKKSEKSRSQRVMAVNPTGFPSPHLPSEKNKKIMHFGPPPEMHYFFVFGPP